MEKCNYGVNKTFQKYPNVSTGIAIEGILAQNKRKEQEAKARIKEQEDTSRTADAIEKLNERIEKQEIENKKAEKKNYRIAIITLVIVALTFAKDIYDFAASHFFG